VSARGIITYQNLSFDEMCDSMKRHDAKVPFEELALLLKVLLETVALMSDQPSKEHVDILLEQENQPIHSFLSHVISHTLMAIEWRMIDRLGPILTL
jgi:hypothetical protein